AGGVGERGGQLQPGARQLRQQPLLPQAQPHQRRALQRKHAGGGVRRQRQRHRQRGKADRQQRMSMRKQLETLASPQQPRQRRIHARQRQRAERKRHAIALEQCGLQRERDQRRAEQQAAVDQVASPGRTASRIQDRQQQVEPEEQQQELLGTGQLVGR